MKTKIPFLAFFLLCIQISISQVGVNNVDPQSMLDITASNVATPANTDGILIPRVDDFPATNPTTTQNGMLIFATGAGTPTEGFYWWDFSTLSWIPFTGGGTGAERIDDLTDGKSDVDGSQDGSSIFLGITAGAADDASDNGNIGIGYQALNAAVGNVANEGVENVAVGYQTLTLNTSGRRNTALGYTALTTNSSGQRNTAIGQGALEGNTIGDNNTAIGAVALNDNTTGDSNVAVGYLSLATNTTGINNNALGNQTLRNNEFGDKNTAIGDYAGRFLDDENLVDLDNDDNVYIGSNAGNSDINASQNVYIGSDAGAGLYTSGGSGNGNAENKSGNIFIGYRSGYNETGSDKLYIENSSTASPLIYGEFDNNILRVNGTLQVDDPTGTGYAFPAADGTANQVLTTDGAGAVTWAAGGGGTLAASRATVTTNQTIASANTWTKVNFDATDFDLNNDYDEPNDEFDVPADGVYRITAMYTSDANENNSRTFGIRIVAGGNNYQEVNYKQMNENSRAVRQVSALAELDAADTIYIEARVNVASGLTIDNTSKFTSFSVERVR
ncbi:hypothetical protein [Algibacter sp. 2305UL17-15]|uniref:C1q-like domain-containing protein n=1 Tax=Algibacter sp. 2305UL17-15 TaxID=3231268 RepID=UPI00345A5AEA